MESSTSKN
jgi:hypothetical protein